MICKKCSKEISDGLATCPECGAAQTAATPEKLPQKILNSYKNFGSLSTVGKVIHIAVPAVILILVIVILVSIFKTDYVEIVQDGMLTNISDDETVGEAFEDFFDEPEWDTFESDKGKRIVEFNGICEFYGDEADVCIQFEVDEDKEEFEVTYISIDGDSLNDFEIVGVLEAIYED